MKTFREFLDEAYIRNRGGSDERNDLYARKRMHDAKSKAYSTIGNQHLAKRHKQAANAAELMHAHQSVITVKANSAHMGPQHANIPDRENFTRSMLAKHNKYNKERRTKVDNVNPAYANKLRQQYSQK